MYHSEKLSTRYGSMNKAGKKHSDRLCPALATAAIDTKKPSVTATNLDVETILAAMKKAAAAGQPYNAGFERCFTEAKDWLTKRLADTGNTNFTTESHVAHYIVHDKSFDNATNFIGKYLYNK